MSSNTRHHRVAGGGAAGLPVAAALLRQSPKVDVAVIEASDAHDYPPGWRLVGGGDMRAEDSRRREAEVVPDKARWIRARGLGWHWPKPKPRPDLTE